MYLIIHHLCHIRFMCITCIKIIIYIILGQLSIIITNDFLIINLKKNTKKLKDFFFFFFKIRSQIIQNFFLYNTISVLYYCKYINIIHFLNNIYIYFPLLFFNKPFLFHITLIYYYYYYYYC